MVFLTLSCLFISISNFNSITYQYYIPVLSFYNSNITMLLQKVAVYSLVSEWNIISNVMRSTHWNGVILLVLTYISNSHVYMFLSIYFHTSNLCLHNYCFIKQYNIYYLYSSVVYSHRKLYMSTLFALAIYVLPKLIAFRCYQYPNIDG